MESLLPLRSNSKNAVKSTRSTVGTITEVNDYLKLLFPRVCQGFDPVSGEEIEPETPESIYRNRRNTRKDAGVLILFSILVPEKSTAEELFDFLRQQGYLRIVIFGKFIGPTMLRNTKGKPFLHPSTWFRIV